MLHPIKAAILILSAGLAQAVLADDLIILNNNLVLSNAFAGTTVTNRFILSNSSARIVPLLSARPTCGCTFAKLSTNALAPGHKAVVEFGFKGAGQPGPVTKRILLDTTPADQSNPSWAPATYFLVFTAHVRDALVSSAGRATLSAKSKEALKRARVEIRLSSLVACAAMELVSLSPNNEIVKVVRLGKPAKGEKEIRILVTVDPSKMDRFGSVGMFSAVVSCDGNMKTFNIPVFVELTSSAKKKQDRD
jgi:hypothetical protein